MRNERGLYKRVCDLCKKEKIMMFHSKSPFTAYCFQCWWSDGWDATKYAREYDFSKPFFTQFKELLREVPRPGIIQQGNNVNSEYTNLVSDNKNCYLIFASANNENCSYGVDFWDSKDSMDCYNIKKSELCYECNDCFACHNLRFSQECNSCADSSFLFNCRNCTNCFGCTNLRNKTYCIFNKQYTKDEYQKLMAQYDMSSSIILDGLRMKFKNMKEESIVPALVEHNTKNVSGNWLEDCKDTKSAFACFDIEEGKNLFGILHAKDVMDYTYWGMHSELMYETINVGRQCANVRFANESWDQVLNTQYSMNCHSSSDLFGCVGLKKKQYCILNKEYLKEEYEKIIPKIIDHMNVMPYTDMKGRVFTYGEFFPPEFSPFAYNETIAQEYFPITKQVADDRGYKWREPDSKNYQTTRSASDVPDRIEDATDAISKDVIECAHKGKCNEQCTTAFRINVQDLQFYKRMNVALPRLCPNCRYYMRLAERTPLKLWRRACECTGIKSEKGSYTNSGSHFHGANHCPNQFETSYAPERKETVYCVQCYQAEVA